MLEDDDILRAGLRVAMPRGEEDRVRKASTVPRVVA